MKYLMRFIKYFEIIIVLFCVYKFHKIKIFRKIFHKFIFRKVFNLIKKTGQL